jgi:hypothetical protein
MRIKKMQSVCVIVSLIPIFCSASGITTPTGFYYPVGSENLNVSSCGQWLERPKGGVGVVNDCYPTPGMYHIGVDMIASENTAVRAIADGKVILVNGGAWGTGNVGIFIEHQSVEQGFFTALYGHIRASDAKLVNATVKAGEIIGYIGHYDGGDHLHFGMLNPGIRLPKESGYGRWDYAKYGVLNGNAFYDNGFIDPINFITHNGPDNTETRKTEAIPGNITPDSSWFLPKCWSGAPDARCDASAYMSYLECTLENSSLCSDAPSQWSAIAPGGLSSGSLSGAGGDSSSPINLEIDFDIMHIQGYELYAGKDTLMQGSSVDLRVQTKAIGGNTVDWIQAGRDTIETDYWYRISNTGSWTYLGRKYTKAVNLPKGSTHTETLRFTIPNIAGQTISFKAKIDAEQEVWEWNELDNTSRVETFQISATTTIDTVTARRKKNLEVAIDLIIND